MQLNRSFRGVLGILVVALLCADSLGAEELTRYFVAFLHKGPQFNALPEGSPERQEQHKNHVSYIEEMVKSGKMVTFGPFADAGDLRGMYIFKVSSLEEAQELANKEPSVKTGFIVMRVYAWYSPTNLAARAPDSRQADK